MLTDCAKSEEKGAQHFLGSILLNSNLAKKTSLDIDFLCQLECSGEAFHEFQTSLWLEGHLERLLCGFPDASGAHFRCKSFADVKH